MNGPATKRTIVATDDTWKVTDVTDVAKEDPIHRQYAAANFDDAAWKNARVIGKLGVAPWGSIAGADGRPIAATAAESLNSCPGSRPSCSTRFPRRRRAPGSHDRRPQGPPDRLRPDGNLYRVTAGPAPAGRQGRDDRHADRRGPGAALGVRRLYVVVNGAGVKGPDGKANGGLYRVTRHRRRRQVRQGRDAPQDRRRRRARPARRPPRRPTASRSTSSPATSPSRRKPMNPSSPHKQLGRGPPPAPQPGRRRARPDDHGPRRLDRQDRPGRQGAGSSSAPASATRTTSPSTATASCSPTTPTWSGTSARRGTARPASCTCVSGGEYGWRNGTGQVAGVLPRQPRPASSTSASARRPASPSATARSSPPSTRTRSSSATGATARSTPSTSRPQGPSYTGTFETFVSGKAFPVTDMVVHPDGNLYLTIGGRGTQSGLYRVTYVGAEPTVARRRPTTDAASRRSAGGAAQARIVPRQARSRRDRRPPCRTSNSPDRHLRYAARIALEWQPIESWKDQVLAEKRPTALINGLIGLIRTNGKAVKTASTTTEPSDYEIARSDAAAQDHRGPRAA